MDSDRTASTVELPDGRMLGYAEYGAVDGAALLLFHGLPGSRLAVEELWPADGPGLVRIIAPDRPGMGLSDFQPGRRFADWAADVAALADALGLPRFAVAGFSGGGPHALAVAHALPGRVTVAGCVSGSGRFDDPESSAGLNRTNRLLTFVARRAPVLLKPVARAQARAVAKDPGRIFDSSAKDPLMSPADRRDLADPRSRRLFIAHATEPFRQGPAGVAHEIRMCFTRWDFDPAEIRVPVHLWHGDADSYVPVAMARRIAQRIPEAELTVYPDEGHMCPVRHWDEIRDTLLGHS